MTFLSSLMLCCCLLVTLSYLASGAGVFRPAPLDCPENEFYACGSACQTTCATLGQPCPIINIRCNDACYCVPGFARDSTGRCILIEKCP
ncbi:inducible metalloproteinase inhibitor protein-like [Teleopsis dalmanni]|uniref:inducible metalloproteinase inhibitor protein-like n=1 Tax=Teleopsis dalmanni TaxID=139649 RepID=UPI000D32B1B0|nr:inducible metalloproteinase inhibitor protein-like [Teleopsis dalmanni]